MGGETDESEKRREKNIKINIKNIIAKNIYYIIKYIF